MVAPGHARSVRAFRHARGCGIGRDLQALVHDQRTCDLRNRGLAAGRIPTGQDGSPGDLSRGRRPVAGSRPGHRRDLPCPPERQRRYRPSRPIVRSRDRQPARSDRLEPLGRSVQRCTAERPRDGRAAAPARVVDARSGLARLERFPGVEPLHARTRGLRPARTPDSDSGVGSRPRMSNEATLGTPARPTARSIPTVSSARSNASRA